MKMKRGLAAFLSGILCLSAFTGCEMVNSENDVTGETIKVEEANAADTDDNQTLLQDALIYTFPLVIMDATVTKATNTEEATEAQAPINQLFHAEALATAEFTDVVTPNVDTIYSQAFLDVSEEAVILEMPQTDRFCMVEVMDAYTNCVTVIDAAQFEEDYEQFIFTGSSFAEEIPEGMTQITCPTSSMWLLIRTICDDEDDIENVYEIQDSMDMYTLTQYVEETTDEKPSGTFDEANDFIPVQHVQEMSMKDYFTKANELLVKNPPAAEDQEMVERIKAINVGAGLTFDETLFGEEGEQLWEGLMTNLAAICLQDSQQYMTVNGCWSYYGSPIAEFGTAYSYRALIALVGLGANPVSVAVYPKAMYDTNGVRLNGANQYVLHFESEQLPPVGENGFWSITAYDSNNNLLIDNELDRYCINDRSDVVYNDDGSLDIYIQNELTDDIDESNWLPVGEGEFHLMLRIYLPEDDVVNNIWLTPTIMNLNEEVNEETTEETIEETSEDDIVETVEETTEDSSEE